jgi:hypothetical protein
VILDEIGTALKGRGMGRLGRVLAPACGKRGAAG